MTPVHAIMVLIIRLWAAGAIISSITSAPFYLFVSDIEFSDPNFVWASTMVLQTVVWLAVGVAAWQLAPKLSRIVYPATNAEDVSISIDADQLVMIGSFLIGGYYLVQYVPEMIVSIGAVFVEIRHEEPGAPFGPPTVTAYPAQEFYTDLSIIVAALWMAFRPAHIARIFSWLRSAGQYDHSRDKLEKDLESSQ